MTDCRRTAWLDLDGATIQLEDADGGWFCTTLDLGYPEVREVMNDNPGRNGAIDRTALYGSRAISASITVLRAAGAVIDEVAASFAPFMNPASRPWLHYILDRPNLGNPERAIQVRPADYTWAVEGDTERQVHLGFVAADPIAIDPAPRSAVAYPGSDAGDGRTYPLLFDRDYIEGGGQATTAELTTTGDLPVWPLVRIYGPITKPTVYFQTTTGGLIQFAFQAGTILNAGQYVDIDNAAKTVNFMGEATASWVDRVDWTRSRWLHIPIPPDQAIMSITGTSTTGESQAQAMWNDRYLT